MTDELDNRAARPQKSAREMTVEGILCSDTYVTASTLKKGPNGVYVNEVYHGRLVKVEKTDAVYVIKLSSPDVEFFENDCVDAVEIIKRELGGVSEMTDEKSKKGSAK
jgi:hypothetical protein